MIEYILGENGLVNKKPTGSKINLCLGFFDGLHVGHKYLIQQAKAPNVRLGVFTFDGSLKSITNKRKNGLITTITDRSRILEELGVDVLFVIGFTKEIMNMKPEEFILKFLKPLNINTIYVGADFSFGKHASGNVELLKKYFNVEVVDFIMDDSKKISTTTIFEYLSDGEISKANRLLGREYFIRGRVIHGFSAGSKKLGFPTANIEMTGQYIFPKNGVYATKIKIDGKEYPSMTNIGVHPTINRLDNPSIETNIFDYSKDIYDKEVKLSFYKYIREEKNFNSIEELMEQLSRDKKKIKLELA